MLQNDQTLEPRYDRFGWQDGDITITPPEADAEDEEDLEDEELEDEELEDEELEDEELDDDEEDEDV